MLSGHSIAFAYYSGKIENEKITYHDTREIFEHDGVTSYTGDLRILFEIRNGKDAYELFLLAFQERRAMDEAFIEELQEKLTQSTYDTRHYRLGERPGEYKRYDFVIGREEIGALPAAYFHGKFENIHPFADGNVTQRHLQKAA